MDMHTDVGDRCVFDAILYLGHDFKDDADIGGNLNMFEVDVNDPYNAFKKTASIKPVHAKLVVINNLDPTIYHSVDPLTEDARRYQLLSSFGIDNLPDWDFEFAETKNIKGKFLNPGSPISIDDHSQAMSLVRLASER